MFAFGRDGVFPMSTLVFDAAGNLYGTTNNGGNMNCPDQFGCGGAFKVTPDAGVSWRERVLHTFCSEVNCADGVYPNAMIFDNAGNLYGTSGNNGGNSDGTVFRLSESGGSWSEDVLYRFDGTHGSGPIGGVIFDAAGNLYGT